MSLLIHRFRVWFETPAGTIHYVEVPAPCFDSARADAHALMQPGERVFCIDQLSEI